MSSPRDVGVVLVAAGRGVRAGGAIPKQFQPVAGVPLLLRALRPFTAHPAVAHVAVVVPPGAEREPPPWLAGLAGDALAIVPGGDTRADSVAAGLAALPPACTLVLVHDAARPFPPAAAIDAVITEARGGRGAIVAVPVADTLKLADPGADPPTIARTVPRDGLWAAQTPQGFPRVVLERAHRARDPLAPPTDDAQLVEAIGHPVVLVPGSAANLKVTSASDFRLAEAVLAAGGGG